MPHLISFATTRFDPAAEKPNPINPIAGHSVLLWLKDELVRANYRVTEPDAEDWGWYMDVHDAAAAYMVGASADPAASPGPVEWMIQVHKHRSMSDKLLGRNKMTADDRLSAAIERLVRADATVQHVSVTRDE